MQIRNLWAQQVSWLPWRRVQHWIMIQDHPWGIEQVLVDGREVRSFWQERNGTSFTFRDGRKGYTLDVNVSDLYGDETEVAKSEEPRQDPNGPARHFY